MKRLHLLLPALLPLLPLLLFLTDARADDNPRPNILFIFSDDHAVNAISAYSDLLPEPSIYAEIAPTPHIDRLANEGLLLVNSFCANSICGPSRATILTGKHSHSNGFLTNGHAYKGNFFDQWTFGAALQKTGYETAVIGKWHLPSLPAGFDHWEILPGQGNYYNPVFIQMDKSRKKFEGYATDLTTDKAIAWLDQRDTEKPFLLMCQHKAPHRTFSPALRHLDDFNGITMPEPDTLFDDFADRSKLLPKNTMEIGRHMDWAYDLKLRKDEQGDVPLPPPNRYPTVEYNRMNSAQKETWNAHFGPLNQAFLKQVAAGELSDADIVRWKYQRYIKNYLRTVKAVDDSVGRLLDYLDTHDLADNTLVIYASDQGFYLGEHGWYDKRWMFEESLRMPFVARWPGRIKPGSRPTALVQNIDYAPTFAAIAGAEIPEDIQGTSLLPLIDATRNPAPENDLHLRDAIYYAYYEAGGHGVPKHFGVRTHTHKLMHFPKTGEWNLFDLAKDPREMKSVFDVPEYADTRKELTDRYDQLREDFGVPK